MILNPQRRPRRQRHRAGHGRIPRRCGSDNGLNLRAVGANSDVLYVLPYGMVLSVLGEGRTASSMCSGADIRAMFPAITSRRWAQ
ncbi:MAG: hypothetical protein ACLUI3_04620 [Christensenellales bacterium]